MLRYKSSKLFILFSLFEIAYSNVRSVPFTIEAKVDDARKRRFAISGCLHARKGVACAFEHVDARMSTSQIATNTRQIRRRSSDVATFVVVAATVTGELQLEV